MELCHAERGEDLGIVRRQLARRRQHLDGAIRMAGVGERHAERAQRVGVARGSERRQDPHRFFGPPRFRQRHAELAVEGVAGARLALAFLEHCDRLVEALELAQGEREVLVALGEIGAAGDELPPLRHGLDVAAARVEIDDVVNHGVDADQILRIVLGTVGRLRRHRADGVAEAAQAGLFLGSRGAALGRPGRFARQRLAELGGELRARRHQVVRLGGI